MILFHTLHRFRLQLALIFSALCMTCFVLFSVLMIRYRPKFTCLTFQAYEDLGKLTPGQMSNLRGRIASVRSSCGETCLTAESANITLRPGRLLDTYTKQFQCKALFQSEDLDQPAETSYPPYEIPDFLFADFSYQGRVPIRRYYFGEAYDAGHYLHWSQSMVDGIIRSGTSGSYGEADFAKMDALMKDKFNVKGKKVLVIGSQYPWVEALLLRNGATHVTTLDYVKITTTHPQIDIVTPTELRGRYLVGGVEHFDAMATFSSIEHSGLGRYGDDLNPWGDLIALARTWCMLKDNGEVLIGIPTGPDQIQFNGARMYGKILLSHLFSNFDLVYSTVDVGRLAEKENLGKQPMFILKKLPVK